ncbi:unnamed protein product, partial [Brassica oleracea var. botrytis]
MRRKRKDHTEINISEFSPLDRNVRKTSSKSATVHPLVPLTTVYKRLYDGVGKDASKNYIGSSVQETSYTPISTANRRKCSLGLDLMLNVLFNSPEPRSCLTTLSNAKKVNNSGVKNLNLGVAKKQVAKAQRNLGIAKKPRKNSQNVLKDITNISYALGNDKEAAPSAPQNGIYEDHLSGDDDTKMDDYNVDDQAYIDEGDPSYTCGYCNVIMWYGERLNKRKNSRNPTFTLCCGQGQVQLPLLKDPPTVLKRLMEGDDAQSKHFQRNMRPYNMVFSFTYLDGQEAKFGQMYIVDTATEAENRANCLSKGNKRFQGKKKDGLKKEIIEILIKMLNEVNPYVKQFRSARDRFNTNPEDAFHMRIYPLLFPYGEDGFRLEIQKGVTEATKKHKKGTISMRQFFAFRLQERKNESQSLLHARRLFQQFLVDAYTT